MARVLSNLCDSAGSKRPIVAQYRIAGVPNGLYNASPGKCVSVFVQVDSPQNITNPFGILKIPQSTSDISQVPVSFDHLSRHRR